MREYRGKRLDNGEWVMGWYCETYGEHFIMPKTEDVKKGLRHSYKVDPSTVGQNTGRGDFYDGDIAKSPYGEIGIITWHDSWCGFYFKKILGFNEDRELVKMWASSTPLYNDLLKYQKIGNRWDNPKLLESKENV